MPKKDRQETGQKKKDKKTNNDLQNTTQKTNDRVTRTPLKTREGKQFLLHLRHPSCYFRTMEMWMIITKREGLHIGN